MSHASGPGQLGFDALLGQADADNLAREIERETAHLPGSMAEAIPFYRVLLRQHHAAMLAANVEEAIRLREEAAKLALRVNSGEPGILAAPDASGCVLESETAAAPGKIPLWGQSGVFIVTVDAMRVRVEMSGIFGIAARFIYWPGFSANVVDETRPFLSETGYRSFLGIGAEPVPSLLPDEFCRKVIGAYVAHELKGKLVAIDTRYRKGKGS
jgi:hypothetical protein